MKSNPPSSQIPARSNFFYDDDDDHDDHDDHNDGICGDECYDEDDLICPARFNLFWLMITITVTITMMMMMIKVIMIIMMIKLKHLMVMICLATLLCLTLL